MEPILFAVGVVATFFFWDYYIIRDSGRRSRWNPLWMAFTLTFVALIYVVPGLFGYSVPASNPVIQNRVVYVGHILWNQIAFGAAFGLVSVACWWAGLKRLAR